MQSSGPSAQLQEFQWPEGFRKRVEAFRRSSVGLSAGRELIEKSVYRFRAFPPVTIDLFENWTANPVSNRSWQWHSASFNFMPWLLALHAKTGDQRAIDHAAKAIESWHRQFVAVESGYEFAWHDHATANRLFFVLSLLCHLDDHPAQLGLDALLPAFLVAHGDRLCLEEMYSKHTNHGIDQSRALLLLALCAPWLEQAERWREVAVLRLEDELGHAFAADGAHVENSPGYHQFVSNLFTDVLMTLGAALDADFREKVQSTLAKAAGFMAWIVRPDGSLPPIGDTECKPAINVYHTLAGTPEHARVQWVCSRGRDGERPDGWGKTFPDAGYFIVRSDWEKEEGLPGDACHLVFRCGRKSGYHRHDDDLAVTLWWGSDWLLDGGTYAYVEGHPVRRYLRSKWGHNVVVVDSGDYGWDRPGAGAPGSLREIGGDAARFVVKGETDSYPGLLATRVLTVEDRGMRFEVVDRISAWEVETGPRKFVSLWHVPAGKTVSVEGQTVRVVDANFMREMLIHNRGADFDRIHVVEKFPNGDEPVWSRELNKFERCQLIMFERSGETFESRLEFQLCDRRPAHREAGSLHARARGLLRSYSCDPAAWWPAASAHHGRKIAARLARAKKAGVAADALVETLLAMAIARAVHRRPTMHLSNMGYPDAGLIEARLRAGLGMLPAGEVYLPTPVQQVIRDWTDEERFLFIDAVHLLHAGVMPGPQMFNPVVNSSQGQYQDVFWRGDTSAVRVLALRDPLDAVLSAMARARPADGWDKPGDAEAMLDRQVQRLERFTSWATRQGFALEFQMEDLAREPAAVLERIGSLFDVAPDMDALVGFKPIAFPSAVVTDAELAALHGMPVRELLDERLSGVRKALGYA